MLIRENTYKKALEIKRNSRNAKQREHEVLLGTAYTTLPRLCEIDRQLSSVGAQLALTALSGDKKALDVLKAQSEALSAEKSKLLKTARVTDISYDCPVCCDTGYVKGAICDCVKELAKSITMSELSQELPLDDCRFDNFDLKYYPNTDDENGINPRKKMTSLFKLCREYALGFNPQSSKNLLFMGAAGLGKTHLTLAVVRSVIEKGFNPVYGPASNLFAAVEKEHFSYNGTENYDAILNCDLLVIDDLGTEFVTQFTQSVLYNLINSRLLSKRPTIINTNLSMLDIESRYSPRISSRLIGNYDARKFFGRDIRQLKAMENI